MTIALHQGRSAANHNDYSSANDQPVKAIKTYRSWQCFQASSASGHETSSSTRSLLSIHSRTSLSLLLPSSLVRIQLSLTLALTGKTPQKPMPSKLIFRGLKRGRVKVEIEDGRVLQISGEGSVEKEDKNDTWHRVERSSGIFLRRFRLPGNAKMDQIKSSMENGVLTVTVLKEEVKKAIEISG